MTLDALADGGVYAGVPKEQALNLVAHTMMVRKQKNWVSTPSTVINFLHFLLIYRDQQKWFLKMANIRNQ